MMRYGDEGAKLANTTIQSIINAYNQEPISRLHNVQAAAAELLQPGAAEAQLQNTEHMRLTNALLRASTPLTIAKSQLELDNERALGTLPKRIMEAKLAELLRSGKSSIDIPLTDADGRPVLDADGKQIVLPNVSSDAIHRTLHGRETGGLTEQNKITNARNVEQDAASRREEARKAEQLLLGPVSQKNTSPLSESPESKPSIDRFNENSDGPDAYVWSDAVKVPSTGAYKYVPGFVQSDNIPARAHKVPLPRDKDGQLTARMAWKAATRLNMTMKEYVEALQRNGYIKGKLPWQP